MGEILLSIDRARIAELRAAGRFFWLDVALEDSTRADLDEVLGIPAATLGPLLDFREDSPPRRKFHAEADHVAFAFSAFADGEAIETHILVTAGYILTLHREPASLPEQLEVNVPESWSPRHVVFEVLEAMMGTAFDALNEVELILDRL